jgi:hypothetical protein
MSGSILKAMNVMKTCVVMLALLFPLAAKDAAREDMPVDEKFLQYLAGVEMLEHSKGMSGSVLAGKYRELCSITGLAADSVAKRIGQFKRQPALWQTVRVKVFELLQSLH